jgi:hypothetical protein
LWTGRPGSDPGICRSAEQFGSEEKKRDDDAISERVHEINSRC